jgi:hypothetical protein|tara:strand:+ start:2763 stop:3425 length:663 start_codon:yes stop_codon:yes gene_type:complete
MAINSQNLQEILNFAEREELENSEPQADRNPSATVEDMDHFDAPIPGQSFTDEPGQWAWERPAQISDPNDAVNYVIQQVTKNEESKEEMRKLLLSGIPIESIVNTVSFGGFTEGKWSADVAELIKLPVSLFFIEFSIDEKIPATIYNESTQKRRTEGSGMDQETMFTLMGENNPELLNNISAGLTKQANDVDDEILRLDEESGDRMVEDLPQDNTSFLEI